MTNQTPDSTQPDHPVPEQSAPEPAEAAPPPVAQVPPPPGPPGGPAIATTAPIVPASGRTSPLVWVVSLALAALVGALLFVGGYLAAGATGASSCSAPSEAFTSFCEAYSKLKDQFVDDLNDSDLADGAIKGMFEYGVQDPFSGYMSPEDYQRALGDLSGEFSGIGAEMGVKNLDDPANLDACQTFTDTCVLVVVAPIQGSPADEAGLQPGDQILAVDDTSVQGMTLSEVVQTVRGDEGTDVTLTIKRGDQTFDETITRAKIQEREVESKMLTDTVGYVSLHQFSTTAADQFHEALAALQDEGATAFVVDLRNNPGGYIDTANRIASEFIGSGLTFIQESSGNEVKRWEATGDGLATDPEIPVVVLVNGGSASASEIVSAALQERGRATIVGQPTYGKNTVQLWGDLDNGGGVRITISRWFTPDHNSVAPDGVQPDVTVEVPDGTPPEQDLFVDKALEILTKTSVGTDTSGSPQPAASSGAGTSSLVPLLSPFSWNPGGLVVDAG
jgi:carboxyl-terminal processing protease